MDPRFEVYNTHLTLGVEHFLKYDPQLHRLSKLPYPYAFPLVQKLPSSEPGIYTLGGGRQIGKSTLLKQWMAYLFTQKHIFREQIIFLSGDVIDDHHQLLQLLTQILQTMSKETLQFIIIDEITYIKDWDKAIKFLADSAQIENTILMLSGSDLTMLEEARMRFPGRRGKSDLVDFHLYPLSFYEYLQLTRAPLAAEIKISSEFSESSWKTLYEAFDLYLQHGGYLSAINDLAQYHKIHNATLTTYSDWIRGDVLKRGKQEHYLKELLSGIVKHYSSQISWTSLSKSLSIDHHKTVSDYMDVLSHMDAVFVQHAILEDQLTLAPKKAKKVFFTDPFVFHAVRAWLSPEADYYLHHMQTSMMTPELTSQLVETVVVNHFRRHYDTFYIKAEGEVDIAYVDQGKFWPIEIKWQTQIRPKDLKQISKYDNACVWTKTPRAETVHGIKAISLPLALAQKFD